MWYSKSKAVECILFMLWCTIPVHKVQVTSGNPQSILFRSQYSWACSQHGCYSATDSIDVLIQAIW